MWPGSKPAPCFALCAGNDPARVRISGNTLLVVAPMWTTTKIAAGKSARQAGQQLLERVERAGRAADHHDVPVRHRSGPFRCIGRSGPANLPASRRSSLLTRKRERAGRVPSQRPSRSGRAARAPDRLGRRWLDRHPLPSRHLGDPLAATGRGMSARRPQHDVRFAQFFGGAAAAASGSPKWRLQAKWRRQG